MMENIKLDLTVQEVNGILQGLGQLPFSQVESLINKVRSQAQAQLAVVTPEVTEQ